MPGDQVVEPSKTTIVIDDQKYTLENLSEAVKAQIVSVQFADARIVALKNELALAETARMAYLRALKGELESQQS